MRHRQLASLGKMRFAKPWASSRSDDYTARQRPTRPHARANQQLVTVVAAMKTIHAHGYTRSYGSPRMTRELQARGHACSKNRVARLMRIHGLRARPRRPFRPKTTTPDHGAHPSPNLLAEADPATAPGVQPVSDITYIPTAEGWLYLPSSSICSRAACSAGNSPRAFTALSPTDLPMISSMTTSKTTIHH